VQTSLTPYSAQWHFIYISWNFQQERIRELTLFQNPNQ